MDALQFAFPLMTDLTQFVLPLLDVSEPIRDCTKRGMVMCVLFFVFFGWGVQTRKGRFI